MSRWRETLCGSVIQASDENQPMAVISGDPSQVLTCGGNYLPRPSGRSLLVGPTKPSVFVLPKDKYEVLVLEGTEIVRHGDAIPISGDDADVLEDSLERLEAKGHK